ncbi:NAD(P)H-dependent oxidoreductase [Bifidobacterium simiarum]|uniref:NAD(P)H oxidoreductase n=2 Tax=Bifidobacterium simiarum TaxID=2045441 RepID=A0A2M9HD24_9BIFI|nr:NAD(P)H-dependent oxidoreductase [Bifidobacterium simiarum]PJM74714.1 NAD(P)H oxidoreductase [Bifidobacterium simiarum]
MTDNAEHTLVLVFHPHLETESVANRRLAEAARGVDGVTVRDVYALYPDGRIDVAAEQAELLRADRIVWQFPMYWYSSPSLLKEWEDEVLAYGWAYGPDGDKLAGKRIMCAVTAGSTEDEYRHDGRFRATMDETLNPMRITTEYVGAQWLEPFAVYACTPDGLTEERLADAADRYAQILRG